MRQLLVGAMLLFSVNAYAFLNPITDVNYNCMFPISLMGAVNMGSSLNPGADAIDTSRTKTIPAICFCGIRPGVSFGMNVPAHVFESTPFPYQFPSLGIIGNHSPANMGGSDNHVEGGAYSFTHTHVVAMNILKLLDLFQDSLCVKSDSSVLDILYLSEVDPLAGSSSIANLLFPESVLTANPVVAASCAADAIGTLGGVTVDGMFWCIGGHNAYPLSNFTSQTTSFEDSSAVTMAKMMYRVNRITLGKTFGLSTTTAAMCGGIPSPMVVKSQYRIQPAIPVRGFGCDRLGTPPVKWNTPKRTNIQGDMVNILWTREDCCAL